MQRTLISAKFMAAALSVACNHPKIIQRRALPPGEGTPFYTWLNDHPNDQCNDVLRTYDQSELPRLLEDSRHPDLKLIGNHLSNRSGSWQLSFPYRVFPVYENQKVLVLDSGSQVDRIRLFGSVVYQWWVIRKSDGVVIDSLQPDIEETPTTQAVIGDSMYLYNPRLKKLFALRIQ